MRGTHHTNRKKKKMIETIAQSVGSVVEPGMSAFDAVMANKSMNWEPMFQPMAFEKPLLAGEVDAQQEDATVEWVTENVKVRAALRSDTGACIGHVGPSYVGIPNRKAFGIADTIPGEITSCGEFGGGSTAWLQMKIDADSLPIQLTSGRQDVIDQYLLIVTGHCANRNRTILLTPIRVWCTNTLNSALRGKKAETSGYVRHSGDVDEKIDLADGLLRKAGVFFKDMQTAFQYLAKSQVKQPVVEQYFMDVQGIDRGNASHFVVDEETHKLTDEMKGRSKTMFDRYLNAYEGNRGGADEPGVRGTLWGAYNAVTYVQDHDVVEEKRRDSGGKTANDRAAYQLFVAGRAVKENALDRALDLATSLN